LKSITVSLCYQITAARHSNNNVMTKQQQVPENATEGSVFGLGRGKYQRNVYKNNSLIGYAVYSNGMATIPQGFIRFEPIKPVSPPSKICDGTGCAVDLGEKEAEMYFENIPSHAQLCQDCQYEKDNA